MGVWGFGQSVCGSLHWPSTPLESVDFQTVVMTVVMTVLMTVVNTSYFIQQDRQLLMFNILCAVHWIVGRA